MYTAPSWRPATEAGLTVFLSQSRTRLPEVRAHPARSAQATTPPYLTTGGEALLKDAPANSSPISKENIGKNEGKYEKLWAKGILSTRYCLCCTCSLAGLYRGAAQREAPTEGESEGAAESRAAAAKRTDSQRLTDGRHSLIMAISRSSREKKSIGNEA
ncbi:hypothetical protein E2C01_049486 [Portunus trituberculatus]|uniref:Uncharacterized protein n=1 Tax=Portunus trituberculatus TaxID=210409 RepID=A0A5B7GDA4_PORTR|nr:hypothetical protein [Portunus trituberculatus]